MFKCKNYQDVIMNFRTEKIQDVTVVKVHLARATLEHALNFKDYILDLINQGEKKIIFDLCECQFIDSTFIGAMVSSLKKITSVHGNLRLVYNDEISSAIFLLTRLDKVFKIFTDLQEAINSFD